MCVALQAFSVQMSSHSVSTKETPLLAAVFHVILYVAAPHSISGPISFPLKVFFSFFLSQYIASDVLWRASEAEKTQAMIFQHDEVFECFRAIIGAMWLLPSVPNDFYTLWLFYNCFLQKRPNIRNHFFDVKLFANDSTESFVYLLKSLIATTSLSLALSSSYSIVLLLFSFQIYTLFFFCVCECRKQASYFKLNSVFLSIIIKLDHAKRNE